jgi:hypothetical protein
MYMGNIPSPYNSLSGYAQGLYGLAEIQQAIALYEVFILLSGGAIPTSGGGTSGVLPASLGAKVSAQSLPVVLATDEATLPVSAASLPLPSGAATAAKQPALGTAGSPSNDVLSIQGINGGTILPGLMPDASSYESIGANVTGTIKNSSGRIYAVSCTNLNLATRYLQFFDAANNSGTPKRSYPVYWNGGFLVIGQESFGGNGLLFNTQIIWGFSTTPLIYTAGTATDCILAVRWA